MQLYDVRTRGDASTELFGSRYSKKTDWELGPSEDMKSRIAHSAIAHLQRVGDWEMLVGTSSGEVNRCFWLIMFADLMVFFLA